MGDATADRVRPSAGPSTVVIRPRFVVQAVGWVVLALVALIVLDRSRHILELVVLSVVLAVLLRPPVDALSRRVPRWAAFTVVVLAATAIVAGLFALGTIELRQEIDAVSDSVTERLEQVDPESSLGEFIAEARVAERLDEHLDRLPSQILIGSPDPADGARLALEALLVLILTLYAMVNGPRLVRPMVSEIPSLRWAVYVRSGVAAGAGQVRRLLGIAVVSGLIGFLVAALFDVPGTTVLGLWVGVWSVVPIFGPVIGYAPIAVLASLDGWPQTIGVAAFAGLVAFASWYVDRHAYGGSPNPARVRTGPLGLTIALVVGLQFDWLLGPLVTVFLMAATVSTLAAAGRRHQEPGVDEADVEATAAGAGAVRRLVWGRLDIRSAGWAVVITVLLVACIALLMDLSPVPMWVIVGLVLSVALDPLVEWVDRHVPLGRGTAVATVIVGLLAVVTATLLFAVPSVIESVRDLDDQLPQIARDLEGLPLIGDELAERGIADRLQTTLEELPDRLASDTTPLEGALRGLGDGLVATFWILLITVTALIDGRRVRRGLQSLAPPHRHDGFDRVATIVADVIARYAVGSVAIAAIAGSAAFTVALIGGVPLAPLIGLWAALTNFIPQVGGYLGAAPLVLLGFTTGTEKGLLIAAAYLIYMQVENRVIQPIIVSKAVDIAPFVAMVAVLIGSAAAGVVGAVLVTPLVAVVKSLHREFRSSASPQAEPDSGRAQTSPNTAV